MSEAEDGGRAEVLRLYYVDELSIRKIAKRLSMSRKTVRKHLALSKREPSSSTMGPRRPSLLDPYRDVIRRELRDTPELTAPAMLERLRPLGYVGGISILRDCMSKLRPSSDPEAYDVLHFAPGQVMQVDWADCGFLLPGVPRRVSAFVAVLGHSRMLFIEFCLSQKMGTFLRCMERAIEFFGGVTLIDVFDNMKTVVLSNRPGRDPVFNPRFLHYAAARGFAPEACTPGKPHQKGAVERPIGFMRQRFLPGRRFADITDLNAQGAHWRDTYANNREHDVTGKIPALVFEHIERPALRPPKRADFDVDDRDHTGVTKTHRVRFDRNTYSVSWRLVGQHVHVRADDTHVRIFLGPKLVAQHARCWDIGADVADPKHRIHPQRHSPKRSAHELPEVLEPLGEVGHNYFRIVAATTRSIQRETQRLTFLVEIFAPLPVTRAMTEVMKTGHVGVEYVEYVLRHRHHAKPAPDPLRLGDPDLDATYVPEPDLGIYDEPVHTRDPGQLAQESNDE
jgi:transposase